MSTRRSWLSICLLAAGCTPAPTVWDDRPGPKVLAFFPPLYSLAANVAGPDAQVQCLLTHTGPHDFEPTTRDARALRGADLFLTNGLGLDDVVADRLRRNSGNAKLRLVDLGATLPKDWLRAGGCKHCNHGDHGHAHDHGYDPHVWLGVPEAITFVGTIRDALAKADPTHADAYQRRADETTARLQKLLDDGKSLFAGRSEKPRLLTQHDSLHYFARGFGLEVVDAIALPGREPSAKELAELIGVCREKNVRVIAVEPQYPSHTAARVIRDELKRQNLDVTLVEVDPLETADPADLTADFYERKMRGNLENLARALK